MTPLLALEWAIVTLLGVLFLMLAILILVGTMNVLGLFD